VSLRYPARRLNAKAQSAKAPSATAAVARSATGRRTARIVAACRTQAPSRRDDRDGPALALRDGGASRAAILGLDAASGGCEA